MLQKAPLISRILLGLIFSASAIAGLAGVAPPPEGAEAQAFMGLIYSSGLLILIKVIELVAGLALLSGIFAPMALVVLAPIVVNILFFHITLDPQGIPVGIVLTILGVVAALGYKEIFRPILQLKIPIVALQSNKQ